MTLQDVLERKPFDLSVEVERQELLDLLCLRDCEVNYSQGPSQGVAIEGPKRVCCCMNKWRNEHGRDGWDRVSILVDCQSVRYCP